MNLADISVTILTKNSQRTLKDTLRSLEPFGEVIVYDMGSTDNTREIAKGFSNTKVVRGDFIGYGPSHNMATAATKNNWVLCINSDEVVTRELTRNLRNATLDTAAVYSFPRQNYFNDKWIKYCGWYPDRKIKLYNRLHTRFTHDKIHEEIITTGMRIVAFHSPIKHYPYASSADLLEKMQSYSSLYAEQNCGKKKASLFMAFGRGLFAFIRSYIVKMGFLEGFEGFVISAHSAYMTYFKYVKLHEANRELKSQSKPT